MGLLAYLKTQFVVHLLIGFVFVVSGLVINFAQLCTLVLWPINKQLYRRLNCRLAYSLWSQLVMLLEWWSCTECTLFTDQAAVDHFGKEHVVIILNHNFEIDFLCGWTMCERFGVLGSSKVLAKKELLYVPLIGWTWYFLEIVFCKRKWEEDRDTVVQGLRRLSDYPEYMWFLLYCEGTRFTETKHRVSMEVAASKGLPPLKYHLLPRTKGFTTAVQCLRGTVTAVYDVTLNFRGNKNPSLLGILYGKKYEADMCVRRVHKGKMSPGVCVKSCGNHRHVGSHTCCRPTTSSGVHPENGMYRPLCPLSSSQDALQETYNQTGTFPGQQFKPARRPWTLLNFLCWATVLLSPLFSFALGVFASGSPLLILTFLGFVGAASFGVRRLIGVTEIEKGSSYGNQEFKKE
ncbi:PREDICTED: 1-acyl-sn-glycerol-3-phosphate acyltransferase gamma [Galeopterus variegatus]|uniref:1-acyl-sn-glycerol-3-phosphate acyltransferase gamma n=1 Tax=Galeopterus variegatus TaxID=482537 RepID=A0ABM0QC43_GALVR|nr:PREDICTED: 1-acyl-sn-glycerol-3-phosphate acyltransferase gamma [Galeopterus variegatus]